MAAPASTPKQPPKKTLFERIIARELPGKFAYEDDLCVAIEDINPGAPLHLLVIPRKPMPRLADATAQDQALLGHLLLVANRLAQEKGFGAAYRVVINNGADAGQSVFHLHVHVLAGRPFRWPPG